MTKRPNPLVRIVVLGLCIAIASQTFADTPLAPPEDFTHRAEIATVEGRVETNTTIVAPANHAPWAIPVWARFYLLAPDALSILVLSNGGNLLGSRDPDQIVATVYYVEDGAVHAQSFTLSDTMDPAEMPQTASHFLWLDSYRAADGGWELVLSNTKTITITYR
ncbi:hypothetical protein [Octadecabacter temperatus]|uniref:hypothetical protein n=1 Tax=Octadecabacter temperatus TaxID=1458307 RepID=UPI00117C72AD|nr:hypothetical protein [Octadecabacter temperatus]